MRNVDEGKPSHSIRSFRGPKSCQIEEDKNVLSLMTQRSQEGQKSIKYMGIDLGDQ